MEKNLTYYDLIYNEACKQNKFISVLNTGIESEINRAYNWLRNIGFEIQELREEIDQLQDTAQKVQKRQLLKKYLTLKENIGCQIDVLEDIISTLSSWEGWVNIELQNTME